MPSAIQNISNPLDPPSIELRRIGDITSLWKKDIDVFDTVLKSIRVDSIS